MYNFQSKVETRSKLDKLFIIGTKTMFAEMYTRTLTNVLRRILLVGNGSLRQLLNSNQIQMQMLFMSDLLSRPYHTVTTLRPSAETT